MKKISLKNLDVLGIEKMSRESLKKVAGGNSSLSRPTCNCNNDGDCPPYDEENRPVRCMADCEGGGGNLGHCAWDGTSG